MNELLSRSSVMKHLRWSRNIAWGLFLQVKFSFIANTSFNDRRLSDVWSGERVSMLTKREEFVPWSFFCLFSFFLLFLSSSSNEENRAQWRIGNKIDEETIEQLWLSSIVIIHLGRWLSSNNSDVSVCLVQSFSRLCLSLRWKKKEDEKSEQINQIERKRMKRGMIKMNVSSLSVRKLLWFCQIQWRPRTEIEFFFVITMIATKKPNYNVICQNPMYRRSYLPRLDVGQQDVPASVAIRCLQPRSQIERIGW